tara:strand:- start:512 stop:1918 length:1407 start_codon:yes stop_codon:yes gene_type:complete
MGFFDRFRSKPKTSRVQAYLDTNQNKLEKEARTPVYDMTPAMGSTGPMRISPIYDLYHIEDLATNYSHLQTVVNRIASQTIAKGYRLEQTVENPSEDQRAIAEQLIMNPSNGDSDITGEEFCKALIRQLEIFDDAWVSVVYDYVKDESGQVLGKQVSQLWVEDSKNMRFNTDNFGKFQDQDLFCPSCRKTASGTACSECGTKLELVAYTFESAEGDIPFARDEIIHFNKYSSTARLYGQSPIIGLSKKIETALAIEAYQNKLFRLERPPKGFLDIPNLDETALNRLGEYIAEETRRNPNFVPIISSGEGQSGAKFVTIMPNQAEGAMIPYMDKINQDINASYGVMPLAVGDVSGVGGLNAEGEQLSMMDRTIAETQAILVKGFFDPLLDLLKITDWEIVFNDIDERNEQLYLANLRAKADVIAAFQGVGITVDLDEEGELILPETDFASLPTSQEAEEPSEQVDLYQT